MYPSPTTTSQATCGPEYVEWVRQSVSSAHNFAREHLNRSAMRQKRGYDVRAKDRTPFQPGDLVRYFYPPLRIGTKFSKPWIGPYKVLERSTEIDYKIIDLRSRKTKVVHYDHLKPYEGQPDNSSDSSYDGSGQMPTSVPIRSSSSEVVSGSDKRGCGDTSASPTGFYDPRVRYKQPKTGSSQKVVTSGSKIRRRSSRLRASSPDPYDADIASGEESPQDLVLSEFPSGAASDTKSDLAPEPITGPRKSTRARKAPRRFGWSDFLNLSN